MTRYFFIILFLTSSCSIYDFSDSTSKITDHFSNKENIIVLSPSTEDTLYADNIKLEALLQDPLGIKNITIIPPIGSGAPVVITPTGNPQKFAISHNFLIEYGGTYDISHGQYTINISYDNNDGITIKKDFTFTIKRLSVDYTFDLTTDLDTGLKPPNWDASGFHITTTANGAPIQRVEVAGTLGNYITNAPFPGFPTVSIRLDDITGRPTPLPPIGTVSINVRIISDIGGTSMETIVLR